MVNITLIELHADDGTFSANLPFKSLADDESATAETDGEVTVDAGADEETDDGSSKGKGLAVFGVFLFLIAAAVVVKKLSGDDEPDVDVDTEDVPSVDIATSE